MIVLLESGTVGKADFAEVGQETYVSLQDENGLPIEEFGKVIEILED